MQRRSRSSAPRFLRRSVFLHRSILLRSTTTITVFDVDVRARTGPDRPPRVEHPPPRLVRSRWFLPERDPLGQCVRRDRSASFLLLGDGDLDPARKPLAPFETTASSRDHEGRADPGRRKAEYSRDHALGCGLGPAARDDDRGRSNLLGRGLGHGVFPRRRDAGRRADGRRPGALGRRHAEPSGEAPGAFAGPYSPGHGLRDGTGPGRLDGDELEHPVRPRSVLRIRPQPAVPPAGSCGRARAATARDHLLGCRFPPAAGQARRRGLATPLPRRQDHGDEEPRRAYHPLGCLVGSHP